MIISNNFVTARILPTVRMNFYLLQVNKLKHVIPLCRLPHCGGLSVASVVAVVVWRARVFPQLVWVRVSSQLNLIN